MHAIYHVPYALFNYPNNLGEVYKLYSSFSGKFFCPALPFFALCLNSPLKHLFSNIFNLYTCLRMREQVACLCEVSVKITFLHILVCMPFR